MLGLDSASPEKVSPLLVEPEKVDVLEEVSRSPAEARATAPRQIVLSSSNFAGSFIPEECFQEAGGRTAQAASRHARTKAVIV